MRRRIVPWTFSLGMVLCSLLVATRLWASLPPPRVPHLSGHWDGFFLEIHDEPMIGLVRSDITRQARRLTEGQGRLFTLDGRTLLDAYHFSATVSDDNSVAGTGRDRLGRVFIDGGLDIFPGVDGDAGIWAPDLLFVPARGTQTQVSAILLHPFADAHAPNIGAHVADGAFHGLSDPSFSGTAVMKLMARERGSYPGTFTFTPAANLEPAFSWPVRVTTSASRQFIMIGQGKTGRMSYIGSVITQNGSPSEMWGIAKLSLADGRVIYNAYNATLTSVRQ